MSLSRAARTAFGRTERQRPSPGGPRSRQSGPVGRLAIALLGVGSTITAQGPFHARHSGQKPGEQFGTALAFVTDIDEDHIDELVVSAPFGCREGLPTGRVVLLSGADGHVLWERFGTVPHEGFGSVLTTVGDLDLDGVEDIAVGTPLADGDGDDRGEVRILSGRSGQSLRVWTGKHDRSGFGRSIANAGDLDGDGYDDIAIGAPEDSLGLSRPGSVTVYSGGTDEILFRIHGLDDGERFGTTLAGGIDLDDDHAPDLLVGAPQAEDGAGRVYLLSGIDGHELGQMVGRRDERLGTSLTTLDPEDDVRRRLWAAGAPEFQPRVGPAGRILIVHGLEVLAEITAEELGLPCGETLAPVGDIDGDHYPDLLTGSTKGHVALVSGATHRSLFERSEGPFGSGVGRALAGRGQADTDNFPEWALGRPFDPGLGPVTGAVDVFDLRTTGSPPRVRRLGAPCGHSRVRVPRAGIDGSPYLARRLALTLSGGPPNGSVTLLLGPVAQTPLERFGLDRCMLHTTTDEIAVPTTTDATGRARIGDVPIPARRAVIGRILVSQWICPVGNTVQTSDAIMLQLGH